MQLKHSLVWSAYAFQVHMLHISPIFELLCSFLQGPDVTATIHWDTI